MVTWKAVQAEYDVAVIGAGASGLLAAITAARAGAAVLVIEHMPQAAKKILVTGNGRCNYTNRNLEIQNYYCRQPGFVETALSQFDNTQAIRFFEGLGIRPVQKNGSCIYPESEQASSVRMVLLDECKRMGITFVYEAKISKFVHEKELFLIHTENHTYITHSCILATGGKSYGKTGSDGTGYAYAKKMGHTVVLPLPALVPVEADFSKYRLPAGVRISCRATLQTESGTQGYEKGELQITDYGLSGIVIFQLSRIASRALADGQKVMIELDFKPEESEETLSKYLEQRFSSPHLAEKSLKQAMIGLVPDKLAPVLMQKAGIREKAFWHSCSTTQKKQLCKAFKHFRVKITGTKQFDMAQTTTGGIDISELHAGTMESKIVPKLFFAGEMIDVDAKCGGYNLQWAWSTGYLAGLSAAQTVKDRPSKKAGRK